MIHPGGDDGAARRALLPAGDALVLTPTGTISAASPDLARVLGISTDEGLTTGAGGTAFADLVHPGDRSTAELAVRSAGGAAAVASRASVRLRVADGGWRAVELAFEPAGGPAVGVAVDVLDGLDGLGDADEAVPPTLDELLAASPEGVGMVGPDGRFVSVNPALARLLRYHDHELLSRSPAALTHPEERPVLDEVVEWVSSGRLHTVRRRSRLLRSDGRVVPVTESITRVAAGAGRPAHLLWLVQGRRDEQPSVAPADDELRRQRDLADAVVDTAGSLVVVVDPAGRIERFNRAAEMASGRPEAEVVGVAVWDVFTEVDGDGLQQLLVHVRDDGPTDSVETRWTAPDGTARVILWSATALPGERGAVEHIVATGIDMTDRARVEAELTFQAFHDDLTGLPNRPLLLERLRHALTRLDRRHQELGVLFLDLNHFKRVNDTLGHAAGDRLLTAVAGRLQTVLRPSDTVARFGGDEFVVLCEELADATHAAEIADRIVAALEPPFRLGDSDVPMRASIGVALASHSGDDAEALLRDADAAMYRAKEQGRARAVEAPLDLHRQHLTRAPDETDLRLALLRGEIQVVFQPQVALPEGRIVAVEALVRWHHPERGVISPAGFLPLAEATGLVVPLGALVFEAACEQAVAWNKPADDRPPVVVSFNVSRREIADPGLRRSLRQILARTGADPALLRAELPEQGVVRDLDETLRALDLLRELGLGVSIDDVGSASVSLGYLEDLPVDEVKVDRSVVLELDDPEEQATVAAVVRIARQLHLRIVAEGVEDESQLATLRALGCDVAQGFYFAGPQPSDVISRLLEPDLRWPTGVS